MLHLHLVGGAGADDRLLDLPRRVLADLHAGRDAGNNGRAPGLAELERGAGAAGHEHLLDSQLRRAVQLDQLGDTRGEHAQALRQRPRRQAELAGVAAPPQERNRRRGGEVLHGDGEHGEIDEPAEVDAALESLAADKAVQAILFNGGTGVSGRDRTFDALARKLEKTLPGFGEIFRMLSWEQVGSAAIMSRATAGVYRGTIVVSTPGSPKAVQLAWEKLIAPELEHMVWEVTR